MYTQMFAYLPDKIAGPSDLAGFMEAPQIGLGNTAAQLGTKETLWDSLRGWTHPPNMASRPTVPPIAIPAIVPSCWGEIRRED